MGVRTGRIEEGPGFRVGVRPDRARRTAPAFRSRVPGVIQ